MKTKLDIDQWDRKEHFHFFKKFTEPFHGVSADLECSAMYTSSKSTQQSFFIMYMHAVLKVVNTIDNFKMRIERDDVYVYDKINVSPTIGRKNNTFSFSYIDYDEDFELFKENALKAIEAVNNSSGLGLSSDTNRSDVIHFSTLPWIKFNTISHARMLGIEDSAPKITIGKLFKNNDGYFLPVSVHVHHALADGYHVGQFISRLENEFNSK